MPKTSAVATSNSFVNAVSRPAPQQALSQSIPKPTALSQNVPSAVKPIAKPATSTPLEPKSPTPNVSLSGSLKTQFPDISKLTTKTTVSTPANSVLTAPVGSNDSSKISFGIVDDSLLAKSMLKPKTGKDIDLVCSFTFRL